MKIHLDTDIGSYIDDMLAMVMVLKWKDVEITGITTVADNQGQRAGYVHYALQFANQQHIPVKAGADISGGYYSEIPTYQQDAYWPSVVSATPSPIEEALELLKSSIEQQAVIVAIGPYTNLFLLDQKYPGILKEASLVLMGGVIFPSRHGYPQAQPEMDYNIQSDIRSAQYVLQNSSPTIVPQSVCVETYLRQADLPRLHAGDPVCQLLARQAEASSKAWHYTDLYGHAAQNIPDDTIMFLYDPLACAIALGFDEGVMIKQFPLVYHVENNLLRESVQEPGTRTSIVTLVDGPSFNDFWIQTVTAT